MLVLTRKLDEKVIVGNVTITVVEIYNGKVRLGFEAPPETQIYRAELAPWKPQPKEPDRA